jgi:hypothetical protein
MATFWEKLGATQFDTLNKTLGGLPEKLGKVYDPTGYEKRKAARQAILGQVAQEELDKQQPAIQEQNKELLGNKKTGNLAAGLAGGAKGLMPLVSRLTKTPHEYVNELMASAGKPAPVLKPENVYPAAAAGGELAGSIAAGLASPAAGGLAKSAIPAIAGRKLIPTLARNAITASVPSLQDAISKLKEGGESVGDIAKQFGKSMAIGTGVGTAAEKVLGAIPNLARILKKKATATAIREGLDIDPRSFRKAASIGGKIKSAGAVRDRAEGLGEDLLDLMNKEGVVDESSREAWVAGQKAKWKGVDEAFDASGKKVSDFAEKIKSDPTVVAYLQEHGEQGAKRLGEMVSAADKKAGLADIREYLQKVRDFHMKNPKDLIDADTADVAKAVRDIVDGAFVPPELKADYGKYKAIDEALTREDLRMPKTFSVGSPTAGRMIASGLAGGILGGGTSGIDPDDPEALKAALKRSAIGFAAGSIAPRVGAAVTNKLTGRLAAKLAPLIPELAAKEGGMAGGLAARLTGQAEQPAAAIADQEPPKSAEEVKAQAAIGAQEQAAHPDAKEAAKQDTNAKWADTVRDRLSAMYDTYLAQYSDLLPKEEFFRQAEKLTDGFDPRKTAGFVFTDQKEKEAYLKSYSAALRLQTLQGQYKGKPRGFVEEALTPASGGAFGSGLWAGKGQDTQIAYNQLRDWITSLLTDEGKAPTKATVNTVTRDIDTIIGLKVPMERKKQLIIDHLANYGLSVADLMKYGQLGGLA